MGSLKSNRVNCKEKGLNQEEKAEKARALIAQLEQSEASMKKL